MEITEDTIVALATPPGEGAIAIVRMSGTKSLDILKTVGAGFKPALESQTKQGGSQTHPYMTHTFITDPATQEKIDEVIVSYFKSPHSFTGEDCVEINTHGSPIIVRQVIKLLIECGARMAEPGEFTKRAFLNGKMDLAQAEAVADIISAKSEAAAKNALNQLGGYLSNTIKSLRDRLLHLMAHVEAGFEFAEEDIVTFDRTETKQTLADIQNQILQLLDSFQTGQLFKEGLKVALVGKPNVGKSSLLNALIREDRAIVHDEPGTTRDVVMGERKINGIVVTFYDTAGIRQTAGTVEQEGIRRSLQTIEKADLILFLTDSSREVDDEDKNIFEKLPKKNVICLGTKSDLNVGANLVFVLGEHEVRPYRISSKTGAGIDELLRQISNHLTLRGVGSDQGFVLTNIRHQQSLVKANQLLQLTIEGIDQLTDDKLAEELRQISATLGEITGEINNEDVLGEIFSKFCIGK